MKKTKIILSAIPTFLLLGTMFVSSTFAWFTDFAINSGNRVQSGNLAVEFTASKTIGETDLTGELINLKTSIEPLFNLPNPAQPGDQESFYIRVKSTGNIALNYQIDFVVVDTSILAEVIMFDISRVLPTQSSLAPVPGTMIEATNLQNANVLGLAQNSFEIWLVTMRYDSSADNTYNDPTLDFEVDITLNAWQASNNAPQPVMVRTIADLLTAIESEVENIRLLNNITDTDTDLTINYLLTIDLGGFTLSVEGFSISSSQYGALELREGTISAVNFLINTPNAYFNDVNLTISSSSPTITSR
jgi:hypothetical protein